MYVDFLSTLSTMEDHNTMGKDAVGRGGEDRIIWTHRWMNE